MTAETGERLQRINACVEDVLGNWGITYNGEEDLLKSGMNSMATLQLILKIETEFGLSIPDEMLDIGNFSTIDAISKTIEATV